MSSSKRPVPDPILVSKWPVVALGCSWCGPSDLKLVYMNSESFPKFEFRIRLSGVYRLSKKWVYQPIIPSCHSVEISSSKRPVPDPILGNEVARCSIGVLRVVVQVIQNWFTGIRNPSRSSSLG